mmetsp:Transcript_25383/g.43053  ORF Transcript_25383/g.43053 Transcript_25383/m.43053 type:complete len:283 (-) Transcript_25383:66-914(-)
MAPSLSFSAFSKLAFLLDSFSKLSFNLIKLASNAFCSFFNVASLILLLSNAISTSLSLSKCFLISRMKSSFAFRSLSIFRFIRDSLSSSCTNRCLWCSSSIFACSSSSAMDSVADLVSVGTAGVSTAVRRLDCEDRNGSGGWGASGRIIDDDDDDIDDASFKMLLVCATLASSEIDPLSSNVPATLNALPAANALEVESCKAELANKIDDANAGFLLLLPFKLSSPSSSSCRANRLSFFLTEGDDVLALDKEKASFGDSCDEICSSTTARADVLNLMASKLL